MVSAGGVRWIVGILVVLLAVGLGTGAVGFRYAVSYDNRPADFPRSVIGHDGSTITLDDGRRFDLDPQYDPSADLGPLLQRCENRVRVDDAHDWVTFASRVGFCGFDFPQRRRRLTIPLLRTDLRQYADGWTAPVRPAGPPPAPAVPPEPGAWVPTP